MHDDLLGTCAHGSLRDFFVNGYSAYTFTSAMGMDAIQSLPSPFLLFVLLFKNLNVGYFLAISLKLSLASFFCEFFLEKHIFKKNTRQAVPFAVMYSLCGYCMIYYYNQHFLEGVYMLPYLMSCELFVLKEKTHRKRLVLALTYLFLITYYEGYMVGIFLAYTTFLYGCIYMQEQRLKRTLLSLLELLAEAIFAAGLSAVILLPLGIGLFSTGAIDSVEKTIIFKPRVNDVVAGLFVFSKKNQDATIPAFYTGLSLVILISAALGNLKAYKKQIGFFAGCLAFFALCTFVKPFYYAIHMMNYPDGSWYRFAYMVSFVACVFGAYIWKENAFRRKTVICSGVGWIVVYLILMFVQSKNSDYEMLSISRFLMNAALITAYCFLILMRQNKKMVFEKVFFVLVMAEILVNGVFITKVQSRGDNEARNHYEMWYAKNENALKHILEDKSLYRVHHENVLNYNQASYFGYNSISVFTPAINPSVKRALSNLGYATGTKLLHCAGGSPVSSSLLGEKYSIRSDLLGIGEYYVIENQTAMPFAYASSSYIKDFSMLDTNAFDNQNGLLSCLTGEESVLFQPVRGEVINNSTENTLIYYDQERESYLLVLANEELKSKWIFTVQPHELPVYVLFEQVAYEYDREAPHIETLMPYGQYEDLTLYLGNLIPLTPDENGVSEVSIVFNKDMSGGGLLKNFLAYTYDASVWERAYEKLKDGQMRNITWDGTTLTGDITVGEDQAVLFTSIPYSEYWKVTIDGEVVTTYATLDGAFLAADITPGQHQVEMSYHNKMQMVGGIISGISAAAYVTWCILAAKRKKKAASKIMVED